jgi:hypothetical protein
MLRCRAVHGIVGKLFAAALLTLCVGVHVLEMSGRWDRTFQDANDEAGIVAVVLCIGVAVSVAGTILKRLVARTICRLSAVSTVTPVRIELVRFSLPVCLCSPPPLPLRI